MLIEVAALGEGGTVSSPSSPPVEEGSGERERPSPPAIRHDSDCVANEKPSVVTIDGLDCRGAPPSSTSGESKLNPSDVLLPLAERSRRSGVVVCDGA